MYLYWTDEEAGVIARGAYTMDTVTGLGTWGGAELLKHLKQVGFKKHAFCSFLRCGFAVADTPFISAVIWQYGATRPCP